jgi:hypothetical protein
VINSRGYTEGQKLFFLEVFTRTSPLDKIKLVWLVALITKASSCCGVFGMVIVALRDYEKKPYMNFLMRKCLISICSIYFSFLQELQNFFVYKIFLYKFAIAKEIFLSVSLGIF